MKKITTFMIGMLFASLCICAIGGAQSSPKRRTPVLTSDDLGPTRDVVGSPSETDVQLSDTRDTEVVRGAIAWHRDLRRAMQVARAEGKLVVVDVYADWCGWCKKMDKTIYADPAIVALSKQQVFVKVNAEDGAQGQQFAQQMRVKGYPTTIILDGQGKVLNIAQGYIATPRVFGELVQEARAQAR